MSNTRLQSRTGIRAAAFVACALCTLWLVVQNAILVTLLSHMPLLEALRGATVVAGTLAIWSIPLALVPIAFVLGWFAARRISGASRRGGIS
jgi:hypothetical protein